MVDERALADVAPAHDGHPHFRFLDRILFLDRLREFLCERLEQLPLAPILFRADPENPFAELVEPVRLRVETVVIRLIGDAQDGRLGVSQPFGHLLVQRQNPLAGIDHEQNRRRGVNRNLDLLLDMVRQIVRILDAHPAGIDQLHVPVADFHQMGHPVSGDAGGGVDDRQSPTGKPVKQARLADVGTADNHDLGDGHGLKSLLEGGRDLLGRGVSDRVEHLIVVTGVQELKGQGETCGFTEIS